MDIGLPGQSGFDAARAIRAAPWGREVTLVAVTGWGQDDDRQRSKEAGFDLHLVKPVDPAELMTVLAAVPAHPGRRDADGDPTTGPHTVTPADAEALPRSPR
jgi:CheY-like chemotaxis protein